MHKSFIFAAIALFCQFLAAQERSTPIVRVGEATYKFTDRRFMKDFERTLIFGHSISGNLINHWGGGGVMGPGTVLAKKYAEVEPLANISEEYGYMESGLSKMSRWIYNLQDSEATPGSDRDIELMNKRLDDSSVIIGVDALYMSVVFNECQYKSVPFIIEKFVAKVAEQNKVLILGNVPKERWSDTSLAARMILQNENETCRKDINEALRDSCTTDRNCYLVDLEKIVAGINSTGQLKLKDGTVLKQDTSKGLFSPREVRWDGINLTNRGVQYIVEDILGMMAENPPRDLRGGLMRLPR